MASRTIIPRSRRMLFDSQICVFCRNQRSQRSFHNDAVRSEPWRSMHSSNWGPNKRGTTQWVRFYAQRQVRVEETPARMRTKVDARNRSGFFTMLREVKLLPMDIQVADRIITEFLEPIKSTPSLFVKELASRYKLQVTDLTILALATFRIPDVNDKTGRLPPSKHKDAAKRLIMACSQAKEPTATLHILRAIFLSASLPKAKDVAQNFSQTDIRACRRELEELADQGNPDAMTLLGQFLEQEGSRIRAKKLYEQAVELKEAALNVESEDRISQIAVPQTPPWNLLGQMLLREKDPESREQAEAAFRKGALEGDDPVSYYHLATFQPQYSHDWLQYMTKAASAGHVDAAYQIANFYHDLNDSMNLHSKTPEWAKEGSFAKSLRWLIQWKRTAPGELAYEWFQLAADKGHKPSMLELAEVEELSGRVGNAKTWLEKIIASPAGRTEVWPQTVADARTKLRKLASQA